MMKINLKEISVREIFKNYKNNEEEGVVGYGGKLNIRPPYQREFIYKPKEKEAVIETIKKTFPLNVMYWVENTDGTFEILDGQQRTISFCEYLNGGFSVNNYFFYNLTKEEKEKILEYKLMIYICNGNDREKIDWFKTINIAGKKLTNQELRNAIYMGSWITDAKKKFSKTSCAAVSIGSLYLKGESIRQDYLETVIKWISGGKIEDHMSKHQHNENAENLWLYFENVIEWVKSTFITYRKEMKGIQWGDLYNQFKNEKYDSIELEKEIKNLMEDEVVDNKSGIYYYIFDRKEKHLNLRVFSDKIKREVYEKQNGICPLCSGKDQTKKWGITEMEADHITPWHEGGKTSEDNCQMLCKECNRRKSGK